MIMMMMCQIVLRVNEGKVKAIQDRQTPTNGVRSFMVWQFSTIDLSNTTAQSWLLWHGSYGRLYKEMKFHMDERSG